MANASIESVAPTVEPVTLAEAKLWLRIDHSAEDSLIRELVKAARREVELFCGRQLINSTRIWRLDRFPSDGVIRLDRPPLSSVSSITYVDTAGATQTWATDQWDQDTDSEPGRITLAYNQSLPSDVRGGAANVVTITYVAGYGAAGENVPEPLKIAIKEFSADLYEHRESQSEVRLENNASVMRILWAYRIMEAA